MQKKFFFSDEVWFYLHEQVCSQNYQYHSDRNLSQSVKNPYMMRGLVWCAVNGHCIIGLFFHKDTITSERYVSQILDSFCEELTYAERMTSYFQPLLTQLQCQ